VSAVGLEEDASMMKALIRLIGKQDPGRLIVLTLITMFLWNLVSTRDQAMSQGPFNLQELNLQYDIEFDQNVLPIKPFAEYRRHDSGSGWREDLKFSSDGKFVAIGGREQSKFRPSKGGRIELWHVESGKQTILSDEIATFIHPTWFPVAFSRDSRRLAAADIAGHIKIWDLSPSTPAKPRVLKFRDEGRNTSIATSLCFAPDGKRIFVGAYPTRQLDVHTGQEVVFYKEYAHCLLDPNVIDMSPDGKLIAFGGLSQGIHLLDRESAKLSKAFQGSGPFKQIFFHRFLQSGQFHLTAGKPAWLDPMVSIAEYPSGRITASIAMKNELPAVAVSADGMLLAIKDATIKKTDAYQQWQKEYREKNSSRGYPTMISLWRIENGKPEFLAQINAGSDEMVTAIGISPGRDTLVTSGAHLRLWNLSEVRQRVVAPH
jgi:WD40 repeat protein